MSYDPRTTALTTDELGAYSQIDAWTRRSLDNDFATTLGTLQDTPLGFTPDASRNYLVEAMLLMQSASALVGPLVNWAGPKGITEAACVIEGPLSATAIGTRFVTGMSGTALTLGTFPTANESYLVRLRGLVRVGASPGAGDIRMQVAAAVAGTTITVRARSVLLYRRV